MKEMKMKTSSNRDDNDRKSPPILGDARSSPPSPTQSNLEEDKVLPEANAGEGKTDAGAIRGTRGIGDMRGVS
jgi:hypothetical protein